MRESHGASAPGASRSRPRPPWSAPPPARCLPPPRFVPSCPPPPRPRRPGAAGRGGDARAAFMARVAGARIGGGARFGGARIAVRPAARIGARAGSRLARRFMALAAMSARAAGNPKQVTLQSLSESTASRVSRKGLSRLVSQSCYSVKDKISGLGRQYRCVPLSAFPVSEFPKTMNSRYEGSVGNIGVYL